MEQENNSKKFLGIGIAIVAIIAVLTVIFSQNKRQGDYITATTPQDRGQNTNTEKNSQPIPITTPIDNPRKVSSLYKDGAYTAIGSYMSPGGIDNIGVTVSIKSDVITDVSIDTRPGDEVSKKYMKVFSDNYKEYVIGKNIDTLKLDKVSKSSLTPKGFNDALAKIKSQAKA